MAKYKETNRDIILREDGASIPKADGNRDWEECKDWIAEGNVLDPADPEPVVEPTPSDEERLEATEAAISEIIFLLSKE